MYTKVKVTHDCSVIVKEGYKCHAMSYYWLILWILVIDVDYNTFYFIISVVETYVLSLLQ